MARSARAQEQDQAVRDTGTAIQIYAGANRVSPAHSEEHVKGHINYLGLIAGEGAMFAVGSDAHDIQRLAAVEAAWHIVKELELRPERIWRPTGKPLGGSARHRGGEDSGAKGAS